MTTNRPVRRLAAGCLGVLVGMVAAACGLDHENDRQTAEDLYEPASDAGARTVDGPPAFVLDPSGARVEAQPGSSCWGNGCFDMVAPRRDELPVVGPAAPLEADFGVDTTHALETTLSSDVMSGGCDGYPVLVEGADARHLSLTPSGPAGDRVASAFFYAGPGDASGYWRWAVPPRDGVPIAWVSFQQNSPTTGGMAELSVVVDDAAVDGEVSAEVVVTDADGTSTAIATPEVDQKCEGDGFVEVSTSIDLPERRIDDLGPAPYDFAVTLTIDGTSYDGAATWAPGATEYGGDAVLTFDEPLPVLADQS